MAPPHAPVLDLAEAWSLLVGLLAGAAQLRICVELGGALQEEEGEVQGQPANADRQTRSTGVQRTSMGPVQGPSPVLAASEDRSTRLRTSAATNIAANAATPLPGTYIMAAGPDIFTAALPLALDT